MIDAKTKRELVRAIQTLRADCKYCGNTDDPIYQSASVLLSLLDIDEALEQGILSYPEGN